MNFSTRKHRCPDKDQKGPLLGSRWGPVRQSRWGPHVVTWGSRWGPKGGPEGVQYRDPDGGAHVLY